MVNHDKLGEEIVKNIKIIELIQSFDAKDKIWVDLVEKMVIVYHLIEAHEG